MRLFMYLNEVWRKDISGLPSGDRVILNEITLAAINFQNDSVIPSNFYQSIN